MTTNDYNVHSSTYEHAYTHICSLNRIIFDFCLIYNRMEGRFSLKIEINIPLNL